MRNLLLCSAVLISFNLYAAPDDSVGSVVKMRGTISKILPTSTDSMPVLNDDKFLEDTTLITGPKSFIKIKLTNESELSVGPDSKIVISEMGENIPGIITLVKGRIRAEVQKSDNKFYVRTRTAAIVVNAADFQVIYNPENRVTSLLTFKGAAGIAKLDEGAYKKFETGTREIVRTDKDRAPEVKVIPGKSISEKDMMVKVLNNSSAVVAPSGQTSFTSAALNRPSLPVKISPMQLSALYKNREFDEKNSVNMKSGIESKNLKAEISQAPQKAPVEGVDNETSGEFALKAGGFIDQSTALYITPDQKASLDDKNGTYAAEESGDFDSDTGDYFAPKGLRLDAQQGFLLEKNTDAEPSLLVLREDLNKNIARNKIVGNLNGTVKLAAKTLEEKFIRDELTLSLQIGSQSLKLTPEVGSAPASDLKASGAFKFSALWQIASTKRITPLLGLAFSRVEYGSLEERGETSEAKSLLAMTMGLKYSLTKKSDFYSMLVLDQAHYGAQLSADPTLYQYKRIVLTKIYVGANSEFMRSDKYSFVADASVHMGFKKEINSLSISSTTGYSLKLTPQYTIDEKKTVGFGLFYNVENSTTSNTIGSTKQSRNTIGADLKYVLAL